MDVDPELVGVAAAVGLAAAAFLLPVSRKVAGGLFLAALALATAVWFAGA